MYIRIDIDTKNTPSWNLQFIFHFLNALRLNNMQDTTLVLVACFFFGFCFVFVFGCVLIAAFAFYSDIYNQRTLYDMYPAKIYGM